MTDKQFLEWLRDRLVNVYKESPCVDFVHRLNSIIEKQAKREEIKDYEEVVLSPDDDNPNTCEHMGIKGMCSICNDKLIGNQYEYNV